jgi:hypothetical protein
MSYNIGQVSLPRFRRLNNSMFYESGIWHNSEHWVSPKVYIFCRFFFNILLCFKKSFFLFFWKKNKKNITFSKFKPIKIKIKKFKKPHRRKRKFFFKKWNKARERLRRNKFRGVSLYIYSRLGKISILGVYSVIRCWC